MLDSLSLWVAYFSVITRSQFVPVAWASEDYEEAVRRMQKRQQNQKPLRRMGILTEGVKDACCKAVLIVVLTDLPPPPPPPPP